MAMVFVDRESAYPNRYRVIPDSGEAYHVVLERADEPVTPGTPLNAETFNGMVDEQTAYALEVGKKYASARNLLDNSDFRNPVNQRGGVMYSGAVYTIDRWKSAAKLDVVVEDGFITLECVASASTRNALTQILPPERIPEPGTKVTLAFMTAYGDLYIGGAAWPTSGSVRAFGGDTGYAATIYTDRVSFFIPPDTRDDFIWAALYEGEYTAETLPEYTPKGYAAELAECQRYYLPFAAAKWPCGNGYVSGNGGRCVIPIPRKMRILPSIETTGQWQHISPSGYTGDYTGTVAQMTENHIRIHTSGTSTSQVPASFQVTENAAFSADL